MTSFEAIFDSLDKPDSSGDETVGPLTSYGATASRTGKFWTVTITGLPDGETVQAQGPTWREAESNARKALVDKLKTNAVVFALLPDDPEIVAALGEVVESRAGRLAAEQAERDAVQRAAQLMIAKGWSTRDAGGALHLSHQRISQLAPQSA